MHYTLCSIHYVLCSMHYVKLNSSLCTKSYAKKIIKFIAFCCHPAGERGGRGKDKQTNGLTLQKFPMSIIQISDYVPDPSLFRSKQQLERVRRH